MKAVLVLCALVGLAAATEGPGTTTIFVNNGEKPASIVMGQGNKKLKFMASDNKLELQSANGTVFTVTPLQVESSAFTEELVGSVEMQGALSVRDIYSEDFEITSAENELQGWLIAGDADDVFVNSTLGWATSSGKPLSVQKCGGVSMLGGPGSINSDSVSKTYSLPKHAEVQITARITMGDNWDDDTAFMKVDGEYLWTEEYNWCAQFFTMMCAKGHNACGKPEYPDKLSRLVSVSVPHTAPTMTVEFGTTIPAEVPPSEVWYGISSVSVEVR